MEPRRTGELSLLLRPSFCVVAGMREGEREEGKKKRPKTGGDGNQTSTSNSRARLEARTRNVGTGDGTAQRRWTATSCPGGLLLNYVGARGLIM